jgi:hypothetical protein
MEAIVAGVLTLIGTLMGAWSSYFFQSRGAARSERFAFTNRLHQERMSTYSTFAGTLMDFRRSQYARWHRANSADSDEALQREARDEAARLRATAWDAFFRVELLTEDATLATLAREALEAARSMEKAETEQELLQKGAQTKQLLTDFVKSAGAQVQAVGASPAPVTSDSMPVGKGRRRAGDRDE